MHIIKITIGTITGTPRKSIMHDQIVLKYNKYNDYLK